MSTEATATTTASPASQEPAGLIQLAGPSPVPSGDVRRARRGVPSVGYTSSGGSRPARRGSDRSKYRGGSWSAHAAAGRVLAASAAPTAMDGGVRACAYYIKNATQAAHQIALLAQGRRHQGGDQRVVFLAKRRPR